MNTGKAIGFHVLIYFVMVMMILAADHFFYMKGDAIVAYGSILAGTAASWFTNKAYSSRPVLFTSLFSPGSLAVFVIFAMNVSILFGRGP